MKARYLVATLVTISTLCVSLPFAYAHWRHGRADVPGMMAVWPLLQPNQKAQVKEIFEKERPVLEAQRRSLRIARIALAQALLSGGDIQGPAQEVERAHQDLFRERIKVAQQVIALLTPAQRSAASDLLTKIISAHRQLESAFEQARKQAQTTTQQ